LKRRLLVFTLIAFLLLGAAPSNGILLKRLTVVNKSERDLELELTGSCEDNWYYLHVPAGSRDFPSTTVFTIIPDVYSMTAHYIELWDPVYGYTCSDTNSHSVDATHNVRIVILDCNLRPPNGGEPSMIKLGGSGGGRRRGR
jgi:hypothetical protein